MSKRSEIRRLKNKVGLLIEDVAVARDKIRAMEQYLNINLSRTSRYVNKKWKLHFIIIGKKSPWKMELSRSIC